MATVCIPLASAMGMGVVHVPPVSVATDTVPAVVTYAATASEPQTPAATLGGDWIVSAETAMGDVQPLAPYVDSYAYAGLDPHHARIAPPPGSAASDGVVLV